MADMSDEERQLRAVILQAVRTWHMSLAEVLNMPVDEFSKWQESGFDDGES